MPREAGLEEQLRALDGDLYAALERLDLPAFLLDRAGRVRWLNEVARGAAGDALGLPFLAVVAPEDEPRARSAFARTLLGSSAATDLRLELGRAGPGRVEVELSSVPVRADGRVVGVFGFGVAQRAGRGRAAASVRPRLTPRQLEILRLLGRGRSTAQMAAELGVARETVRNHVRVVLRLLGAHSRLEAVVRAVGLGLIELGAAVDASGSGAAQA